MSHDGPAMTKGAHGNGKHAASLSVSNHDRNHDSSQLPSPTPYRVSTITAIGGVSTAVDLDLFYENLVLTEDGAGYIYAELARKQAAHTVSRGTRPASARPKNRPSSNINDNGKQVVKQVDSRHFDNQVTVIYRSGGPTKSLMNMKVFKNGKIQITGIKHTEQGLLAIDHLVRVLARQDAACPGMLAEPDKLASTGYRVCLINSDFNMGFPIRREKLYAVLRKEYDTVCTFEPCIYPGVKIKYMWNIEPRSTPTGACSCSLSCSGKGEGNGDGDCRKVTIAVFQSGKVIITGAHTLEQIDSAYAFVVSLSVKHHDSIAKPSVSVS